MFECRKDTEKVHVHFYDNENKISNYFNSNSFTEEENVENKIDKNISTKLAYLCSNDGFSFSQLCSENLWDLIYYCMDEVQKQNKFTTINSRSIIPTPNRKQIALFVKNEAEKEKLKIFKGNGEFATLAFDGGKFANVHYFVGLVYFPHKLNYSPNLVCFEENILTQDQMSFQCADVLNKLFPSTKVTNIVLDGLLHQVQAMHHFPSSDKSNFQNFLENNNEPTIFLT
jgi:hypothetical protein